MKLEAKEATRGLEAETTLHDGVHVREVGRDLGCRSNSGDAKC